MGNLGIDVLSRLGLELDLSLGDVKLQGVGDDIRQVDREEDKIL
jgi:hypothetical protein